MNIIILGGSFNPIHNGHISIARQVYQKLKPSKFFFVPTYKHPLKTNINFLSYEKRCFLIKKAISEYPNFEISYLDKTNNNSPSYTYHLIKKFYNLYNHPIINFIIGKDIIYELTEWYNYKWLINNINFIVLTRNSPKNKYTSPPNFAKNFLYFHIKPIDISSTMIREKIKKGEPITNLVPPTIEKDVINFYSELFSKSSNSSIL